MTSMTAVEHMTSTDVTEVEHFICGVWYVPGEVDADDWWQLAGELYCEAGYAYRGQRHDDADMLHGAGELAAAHAMCSLAGYESR